MLIFFSMVSKISRPSSDLSKFCFETVTKEAAHRSKLSDSESQKVDWRQQEHSHKSQKKLVRYSQARRRIVSFRTRGSKLVLRRGVVNGDPALQACSDRRVVLDVGR